MTQKECDTYMATWQSWRASEQQDKEPLPWDAELHLSTCDGCRERVAKFVMNESFAGDLADFYESESEEGLDRAMSRHGVVAKRLAEDPDIAALYRMSANVAREGIEKRARQPAIVKGLTKLAELNPNLGVRLGAWIDRVADTAMQAEAAVRAVVRDAQNGALEVLNSISHPSLEVSYPGAAVRSRSAATTSEPSGSSTIDIATDDLPGIGAQVSVTGTAVTITFLGWNLSMEPLAVLIPENETSAPCMPDRIEQQGTTWTLNFEQVDPGSYVIAVEPVKKKVLTTPVSEESAPDQLNLSVAQPNKSKSVLAEIEAAIAKWRALVDTYQKQGLDEKWAMAQNNLGNAYCELPIGDRRKNIDSAIACYQAAAKYWVSGTVRKAWAMAQNNLGNAYRNAPNGDRSENLQKAIACYEAALWDYWQARFPAEWATTMNNLGNAYTDLPLGDRGNNLEQAITGYSSALEVLTKEHFPAEWAVVQTNLGNAYSAGHDLKAAIACYQAALEVFSSEHYPVQWAATQNNLGIAYCNLISGDRYANLETAISCFQKALEVYTREHFPEEWATTVNNLGNAHRYRESGDTEENLREAERCYNLALSGFFQGEASYRRGIIYSNKGMVLSKLGDQNAAKESFGAAIETLSAFPHEHSAVTELAKIATLQRLRSTPSALPPPVNITKAIDYYQAAA